ncbi:hypothetical protein [Deinococcus soli (ex Cha et al. 2016)]|uniref:Uncharacterized protein n=2 Tax=Deinococcus soli (ex Cha et al. 2016) TaxID=1309411 RepID=A0AAE4BNM4_9DEIO|nr:hypothetical protein [Deinococcus soli (ex Cha et al. 2016)]MDR6218871.1 hypothetical protein [Deinococcus soli (ex Cha et al. 2016)]MDR6328668.1 hypothetical protein [Deinococcus soli (ex Cha et al. 2016)]MDR6751845.1 hypothetical protein [Deinococcus soli (ex Cha et al. 2016)]
MNVNVKAFTKKLHRLLRDQHQVTLPLGQVQQLTAQALGARTWEALMARDEQPERAAPTARPTRTVYVLWNHNDVWFLDDTGEHLLFLNLDEIDSDNVVDYVLTHARSLRRTLNGTDAFQAVYITHKDLRFLKDLRDRIEEAQNGERPLPDLDLNDLSIDDLSDGELLDELLEQKGLTWLANLPVKQDVNGTALHTEPARPTTPPARADTPYQLPAELEIVTMNAASRYVTFDLAPALDALIANNDWKTVLNAVADMAEVDDLFPADLRALLGEPTMLDRHRVVLSSPDARVMTAVSQASQSSNQYYDVAFSAADATRYLIDHHGLARRAFGVPFTFTVLDYLERSGLLSPSSNRDDTAEPTVIYGAFLDVGENDQPAPLDATNVFIAGYGDKNFWTYAPLGQHGGLALPYLHECTLISAKTYARATRDSTYREELRQGDPFPAVRHAVLTGHLNAKLIQV